MVDSGNKPKPEWLDRAIFYQIYPQSFYDSNADGIGDIPGIIAKLDYIKSLGVNTCWINPCFDSPFQDAGYDVADYYQVAPRYGSNSDLLNLFIEARKRNIRILLDLVPGHTSIQHPWFQQSAQPEKNEYSDYFVWTDSAWTWDVNNLKVVSGFSQRDACYITNFFYFQPALNYGFANPDPAQPWQHAVNAPGPHKVRQELKNIISFWLDKGASGFRVDMAFSLVKGDIGRRETIKLWQEIRAWMDKEYPEACLVSEWAVPSQAISAGFHVDFCLPFGFPGYTALLRKPYGHGPGNDPYGFSFFDSGGRGNIMEFMSEYLNHYELTKNFGYISIPTGNHDINPRLSKGRSNSDIELIFLFILTMPGVPCIWFGDEIGMRSFDDLPSKEGGYNRTGARTPMQWSNEANAGFSTANPDLIYLPVDPDQGRPTVFDQENDPRSLLQKVRTLISIRKGHSALQAAAKFELVYAHPGLYPLIYLRSDEKESFLIVINPSAEAKEALIPAYTKKSTKTIYGPVGILNIEKDSWKIKIPGVSAGIYQIDNE